MQRRLKFLALIHKTIKKIGFDFAEEFLSARPNNLREKPTQSPPAAAASTSSAAKSSASSS